MAAILQHSDWLNGRVPDSVRGRLRQLVEVVGYLPHRQPLGLVTADAVLLAANRPLLDLMGAEGDEQLGADWDDVMPGWTARTGGAADAPGVGVATPATLAFEDYLLAYDGRPVWVRVVARPVFAPEAACVASAGEPGCGRDGGEALAAWAVFVVDQQSGPREADGRLRRATLDLLLESPNQFVIRLGPDGGLRYLSPPLRRLLGVSADGAEGRPLSELHALTAPDFAVRFPEIMEKLLGPPYGAELETTMTATDGTRVVDWRFESLLSDGGTVEGILGVGHDITVRKQAEDAARRRVELESMAARILNRFVTATPETAPEAVDVALAETGRRLGADRACLCLLAQDGERPASVRVWLRETGECGDGDPALGCKRVEWVRGKSAGGGAVVLRSPDHVPSGAAVERGAVETPGIDAALVVPVLQDQTLVGALSYEMLAATRPAAAASDAGRRWGDDDVSLVQVVADQLASACVRHGDELNLRTVSEAFLAFGPDAGQNLLQVCRAAAAVTGADLVVYSHRRGDRLVAETGWNLPEWFPTATEAEGRLGADLLERPGGEVWVVHDLQASGYAETSPVVRLAGARAFAGFPVVIGDRPTGALICLFERDVVLRESQLELLQVLGRAVAIEEERRRALEERLLGLTQLEQAMERTVVTLSGAVSARDPYTAGHEKRVARLAVAVGTRLGLDTDDLRLLRLAATVHDLGKIGVPAEILSKPTRLNEAELAIIRGHSEAGRTMLEPAGLPAAVTDAVLQHHERLDGSGYPHGLHGEEIGLFARIIAVADVVEAMWSHRPYRPAIGIGPALDEIEQGAGTRYDEAVADACLRLFRDEGFTFDS